MHDLHKTLLKLSKTYKEWHDHPQTNAVNFSLFLLYSLFSASSLIAMINSSVFVDTPSVQVASVIEASRATIATQAITQTNVQTNEALTAIIGTDKSVYSGDNIVNILVSTKSFSGIVANDAKITLTITTPTNEQSSFQTVTDINGNSLIGFKLDNNTSVSGIYTIKSDISKEGYTNTTSDLTFEVQK